jgi:hypothetical protein
MSTANDETMFGRAGQIIAESRVAALVDRVCRRSLATALASRSLAAAQRRVLTVRRVPAGERGVCLLVVIATAVVGHVVMASMLPDVARPTVTLTALLLIAVCLAVAAGDLARLSGRFTRARHK